MTQARRHLVNNAIFDIGFSSEDTAFDMQSELNGFFKKELLTIVAETFDQFSQANAVIRIPSIEIDLGPVALSQYREELPKRLRSELEEVLSGIRESLAGNASTNEAMLDVQVSNAEILEYFLNHGRLPWYVRQSETPDLDKLLVEVIGSHPQRLRSFLHASRSRNIMLARLVQQFDAHSLAQVYRLLSPSQFVHVSSLLRTLLSQGKQLLAIFSQPAHSPESLERQIWSGLLAISLEKGSRQLGAKDLLRIVMAQLVSKRQDSVDKQLSPVIEQLQQSSDLEDVAIGELLEDVFDQTGRQQNQDTVDRGTEFELPTNASNPEGNAAEASRLSDLLIRAISTRASVDLSSAWQALTSVHIDMLRRVLIDYGKGLRVREIIAHKFSESMLVDILKVIEPVEHMFVKAVIEHSFAVGVTASVYPRNSAVQKEQLWNYSLGYLLVERGSRFNKKSYMQSLIRQMAMSSGIDYQDLLTEMQVNMAAVTVHSSIGTQMMALLQELSEEEKAIAEEGKSEPEAACSAYELYDELRLALLSNTHIRLADGISQVSCVTALRQQAPWLLQRLLQEIMAGEFGRPIDSRVPYELVRALVYSFPALKGQQVEATMADLLAAIDRQSDQAGNKTAYFSRVLFCLLEDSLIDVEAIIDQISDEQTVELKTAADFSPNSQLGSDDVALSKRSLDDDEQLIARFIKGEEASIDDSHLLALAFDRLATLQPKQLRTMLLALQSNGKGLEQVVAGLPDRLLERCVALLSTDSQATILPMAETLTLACYGMGTAASTLQRLKWQALLSYLVERGGLQSEKDFLDYLYSKFIEALRPADVTEFSKSLRQQLTRHNFPQYQAMTRSMLEWIDGSIPEVDENHKSHSNLAKSDAVEDSDQDAPDEQIFIDNAGLVLLTPYLARLFAMLNLHDKGSFRDAQSAERAVHLLQYLVTGATDTPEHQLVLNKQLCGVKPGKPIARGIEFTSQEILQLDGLLTGVVQNWKALGNTTIDGLRESFLQRQGRLERNDDAWHLLVESKAYDMLLDQLPWGYSTIKFPWMERVIYVDWR